ncbi:MAG: 30S ribosomal protein S4 [Euryarchaeota archaeon]|jgi:small subunit ribosomal protein S4|nr:30S ribosomal protein S4 [Euryarchaeota archaeon]MDP6658848.1 30S ribosomal protein S4 [Candidatus Poseidoniia archaeon]MDP6846891.1 30S ribosomal protein S4 [Candidatus Poseidoniia archaeon]MDP7007436.1 30S ribosomal protein S4 [Candidatus Poseidoniia archaeon]|tara:strand:- start:3437 stop:4228 length:792 start_codon:yes stop_codon:yes gene_type:complete
MGDPRFPRKHYDTPSHPWQKERIEKESALVHQYGLKNKREIWKAGTRVRQMRQQARKLTATASEQAQKERRLLLGRLDRLGLLDRGSDLEDVLRMDVEKLLDRRLQTQVYLQGLASTPKQSRQLITHGHITIDGAVARVPGMLVTRMQEKQIAYFSGSPLMSDLHPVRPKPRTDADFDTEPAEDEAPAAPAAEEKAKASDEKQAEAPAGAGSDAAVATSTDEAKPKAKKTAAKKKEKPAAKAEKSAAKKSAKPAPKAASEEKK